MAKVYAYSTQGLNYSSLNSSSKINSKIKPISFKGILPCMMAALCLFGVLALKVSLELRCTELSYILAHQQKRTVAYEMERRELDLQLSVLQRLDVLKDEAQKLGLKPLKAEQIKIL